MSGILKHFRKDEDGAVTVDWVVLTAAVIGLGMIVINVIAYGTDNVADQISTGLNGIQSGYGQNSSGTGSGG